MHLLIKMSWRMDEDLMVKYISQTYVADYPNPDGQAYKEIQRFARATISTRASITPLRVQNIEVVNFSFFKIPKYSLEIRNIVSVER